MAIYAIDFDNTLAITRFPEIVAPNKKMVAFAKAVKAHLLRQFTEMEK